MCLYFRPLLLLASGFLRTCSAQCSTEPFCDNYPACSRDCMGGRDSSTSFYQTSGTDMFSMCAGMNRRAAIQAVFACVSGECSSQDAQAAWNRFVDDCARKSYVVKWNLTPPGYQTHCSYQRAPMPILQALMMSRCRACLVHREYV